MMNQPSSCSADSLTDQVAMGTPSQVPLQHRAIIIAIFRGAGTNCMVHSDWDLASMCVCSPNFISDLIGESSILSTARSVQLILRFNSGQPGLGPKFIPDELS